MTATDDDTARRRGDERAPTIGERVSTAGHELTAAERRVAAVVLDHPQLVAFGTVATLAGRADVGAATVVRLAGKLGFDGFSALQNAVRGEVSRQLRPAAERIRDLDDGLAPDRHQATMVANVQQTLDHVEPATLTATIDQLATVERPVAVIAGDAASGIAAQFVHDLGALRGDVTHWWGSDVHIRRQLALAGDDVTIVVIDLPRYERWVLEAARAATASGAVVVALTDGPLSPLAAAARYVFTLAARSWSPFESQVGTLALLELLVGGVAERLKPTATARLDAINAAWNSTGALTDR